MKHIIRLLALAGVIGAASTALVSTAFAESRLTDNRSASGFSASGPRNGGIGVRRLPLPAPSPVQAATTNRAPIPASAAIASPTSSRAWTLYRSYCFSCHGPSKQGVSPSIIKSAIASVSAMKSLSSLNFLTINGIAAGQ